MAILLTQDCSAYEASNEGRLVLFEKDRWSAICRDIPATDKDCPITYAGYDNDKLALVISGEDAFIIFDGIPDSEEFNFAFDNGAPWPLRCRRVCYIADQNFVQLHEALLTSRMMRIESTALASSVTIEVGAYREALAAARAFNNIN